MSQNKVHVLIAAAGEGTRFLNDNRTPKQYCDLNGKSILRRTIEKFIQMDEIFSIQCIINPAHKELYDKCIDGLSIPSPTNGADTRQKSVHNGLKQLNANKGDIILIHDAARPLFLKTDVRKLIDSLKSNRAATLACPVADTLRDSDNATCKDIVPRETLWSLQTPQAFYVEDILKAHETFDGNSNHTDDTSLLSRIEIDVKLIEASSENFKITTQSDMQMAEKILSSNSSTRTGLGYDVHAFDENASGPVRIGGIDIPHTKKLKGHSDADVALHAITDAMLGAIGQGDIGQHFPPSDNQYKDMDSAVFLKKSNEILKQNNAKISNIDLTIICEEPKIGPHAPKMRQRIASLLGLSEDQINIKATTSEQLGFTGRKEGIAAQAIATITKYDE